MFIAKAEQRCSKRNARPAVPQAASQQLRTATTGMANHSPPHPEKVATVLSHPTILTGYAIINYVTNR